MKVKAGKIGRTLKETTLILKCPHCQKEYSVSWDHYMCPYCGEIYTDEEQKAIHQAITSFYNHVKDNAFYRAGESMESMGSSMQSCGSSLQGCGCFMVLIGLFFMWMMGML